MKRFLTLFCTLFIAGMGISQNNSITIYNPNGEQFLVFLNGIQQTSEPYTDVKIVEITTGTYEVKLMFQDGNTGELNKKILIEQPDDYVVMISGKGKKRTLKFATLKSAKKLVPTEAAPVQYRPNDQFPFSDKKSSSLTPDIEID